ncbi:MAG: type IV-A pilus assembly ATPase PilB [Candidatus Rokuibacteriota bacterium]
MRSGTVSGETEPLRGSALGRRLGDLVAADGLVTGEQLARAIAEQKRSNEKLGAVLVRLGFLTEEQLVRFLARQYTIPVVSVPATIASEILRLVPAAVARKYHVVPIGRTVGSLTIAMVDPTNLSALDEIGFRTGLKVVPVIARPSEILRALEAAYGDTPTSLADVLSEAEADAPTGDVDGSGTHELDPRDLRAFAENAPVVRLVNTIFMEAVRRGASDIHLDPYEKLFRVRFRVDGILHEVMTPPKRLEAAVVSRIKIMASLDIAERRLPQDGRIKFRWSGREMDFRVSVLPTIFGESVCLRLLNNDTAQLDLSALGLDSWSREHLDKAIRCPHGMILITGPTGAGKTTTLYAALHTINSPDLHIVTLEDPVEYNLKGINQVQVNDEIGLTFAAALRSFLRHDPNVILVGEMRDTETAQIAVRASLTGHLILSTLHTNDCASTIARLLDMQVAPFLLSSAVRLVVAQRLVRKVCQDCKDGYEAEEDSLVQYGHTPQGLGRLTLYRGTGCAACNFTGLKGRVALYEVMPVSQEIRELILGSGAMGEIGQVARNQGMKTLRESGLLKVIEGVTTVEEVLRVTAE